MSTGTPSPPVTALVAQLVWLYLRLAGIVAASEIPTENAVFAPVLIIVTNAVAATPTWTERLEGSTAATRVVGGGGAMAGAHGSALVAKSNTGPFAVAAWTHAPDGLMAKLATNGRA